MSHASTLGDALARTRFVIHPERYVLVGVTTDRPHEVVGFVTAGIQGRDPFIQILVEPGLVTLFLPTDQFTQELSDSLRSVARAIRIEENQRTITFETPMTWDVVGFLARVSGVLAEAGVPIGAICGFDRDHIFIQGAHVETARKALRAGVCPGR